MARNVALHMVRTPVLRRTLPFLTNTKCCPFRPFHASQVQNTDGVFKALTEMRVRKPWIEALREKREAEKNPSSTPVESVKPDLTPKKMSDSYTSVVLPLSVSGPSPSPLFRLTNVLDG